MPTDTHGADMSVVEQRRGLLMLAATKVDFVDEMIGEPVGMSERDAVRVLIQALAIEVVKLGCQVQDLEEAVAEARSLVKSQGALTGGLLGIERRADDDEDLEDEDRQFLNNLNRLGLMIREGAGLEPAIALRGAR